MSVALQAEGLTYRYPNQDHFLFQSLSFSLYAADKVALMGANGVGKTTLLALLNGDLSPLEGHITRRDAPYYLRQEDLLEGDARVLDALLASLPDLGSLWAELRRMEEAGVPDPLRYAEVLGAFAERGGYEVQGRLEAELDTLDFSPEMLTRSLTELSGGERRLLRLVAAFMTPQSFYLFDEPTNYLDARGVRYLVTRLRETPAACLIVSHDRRFLDETVTGVWELERGQMTRYRGSYSSFRATKEARHAEAVRTSQKLGREIGELREQERTYKVWGARKEKEKSKVKSEGPVDKGFIGARAARLAKRGIQAKERLRERAEALEEAKPWVEKRYTLAFDPPEVPRGVCLSARFFNPEETSLLISWGERVALTGGNGVGKTTLLRALLEPNTGGVHWDTRAVIGYLPQRWDASRDFEAVAARFPREEHDRARTLLGALGVGGETFAAPLGALSEGQKRKVRLVEVVLARPNVLVLDEPTTHLDYTSIEMLEAALTAFDGTILFVTHDAYLLERIAQRVLEVAPRVSKQVKVPSAGA